jgi:hypothetical protein
VAENEVYDRVLSNTESRKVLVMANKVKNFCKDLAKIHDVIAGERKCQKLP